MGRRASHHTLPAAQSKPLGGTGAPRQRGAAARRGSAWAHWEPKGSMRAPRGRGGPAWATPLRGLPPSVTVRPARGGRGAQVRACVRCCGGEAEGQPGLRDPGQLAENGRAAAGPRAARAAAGARGRFKAKGEAGRVGRSTGRGAAAGSLHWF
ncbi:MAG: hypothetical protein J3K34DRAFT_438390 [Monoraphidium minutum]|nr:MAG: hypothetical protein J3K34DRAFT_438390 [Monoraphidium minutum]